MRLDKLGWAMSMAEITSERSTCLRRAVGCVLLDRMGQVLSTGFNGVARGQKHCNDEFDREKNPICICTNVKHTRCPLHNQGVSIFPYACEGAQLPSGTGLDLCEAIHAEQNALLQCRDAQEIAECYTTTSPCVTCVKLLLNTSCFAVYFRDEYPQPRAKELWVAAGRTWTRTRP